LPCSNILVFFITYLSSFLAISFLGYLGILVLSELSIEQDFEPVL